MIEAGQNRLRWPQQADRKVLVQVRMPYGDTTRTVAL